MGNTAITLIYQKTMRDPILPGPTNFLLLIFYSTVRFAALLLVLPPGLMTTAR